MKHSFLRECAAPSSTLLKYLRAQCRGQPFFSANHAPHHTARPSASSNGAYTCHALHRRRNSSSRSMATFAPSLEASLIPQLNSLFSTRSSTSSARTAEEDASPQSHLSPASRSYYHQRTLAPPIRSAHTSADKSAGEGWSSIKGWRRYWGNSKKKSNSAASNLQPDDIPPLTGFLDDSPSLGRVVPRLNELRLRCTEFDEHGEVMMTNREFRKSELIAKVYSIHSPQYCRDIAYPKSNPPRQ